MVLLNLIVLQLLLYLVADATYEGFSSHHYAQYKLNSGSKKGNDRFNIVYIKSPKASSSTVGGIVRRIAAHHNMSGVHSEKWIAEEPGVWANHGALSDLVKTKRVKQLPVFLMSFVRDPFSRCVSAYYHFQVTRAKDDTARKVAQDPSKVVAHLKSKECLNVQTNYLRPKATSDSSSPDGNTKSAKKGVSTAVQPILHAYDFLGSTEMFDESVVALAYTLDLSLCDVLFLKSKDSRAAGALDGLGFKFVPVPEYSQLNSAIRTFGRSQQFLSANRYDYELLHAAERKLRRRMASTAGFNSTLAAFRELNAVAASKCSPKKNSETCYWNDNGCGYPCLDQLCLQNINYTVPMSLVNFNSVSAATT